LACLNTTVTVILPASVHVHAVVACICNYWLAPLSCPWLQFTWQRVQQLYEPLVYAMCICFFMWLQLCDT